MTELIAGIGGTVDYHPTLNGQPYDPVDNGGSMTDLRLYSDPERTALLVTVDTATKVGTGHYRFAVPAAGAPAPGHVYAIMRWVPRTGAPTVADDNDAIPVWSFGGGTASGAELDIITLAEAKDALNIKPTEAAHDAELPLWIAHASEVMDGLTGPNIIRAVTQDFDNPRSATLILAKRPVRTITAVTVHAHGVTTTYVEDDPALAPPTYGYRLNAGAGMLTLAPARWMYGTLVRVAYTVGRATTIAGLPPTIRIETARLLAHNFQPSQLGRRNGSTPTFAVPHIVSDNLRAAGLLQSAGDI